MARLCIPIENFEGGLYIHPGSAVVVAVASQFSATLPEVEFLVGAHDFMEVQRERDELKRTLARINAIRATKGEFAEKWERACDLLQLAGFDGRQAEATAALIDWAMEGGGGG